MTRIKANAMQESIQIIIAEPDDAEQIVQVQREAWLAAYPNDACGITYENIAAMDFTSPERVAKWQENITKNDDRKLWVAKVADQVVGYCVARAAGSTPPARLQAIYLLPEFQGKGIGKLLMQTAIDWLGRDTDITLDVATYNTAAMGFYEKFGFVKTGVESETGPRLSPGGVPIPQTEMILQKLVQ